MAKKLKRFYKKKYTSKKFEKKLMKKVFLQEDKDLVLSIYEKKDDRYYLTPPEDAKDIKKLNKLVSGIKKNSGALGIGKIGVTAIIVAAIVIFFAFFLSPLVHIGMEKGLEAIFGGQTEIKDFSFNPFKGYIKYSSLEVADKKNLNKNLFQTGRAAIELDMYDVLRGKVHITEIALEDFAIGEKRTVPAKPLKSEKKAAAEESKTDIDSSGSKAQQSFLPDNLIPDQETIKKVINENIAQLSTPGVIEDSIKTLTDGTDNINNSAKQISNDIEKLVKEVEAISKTKMPSKIDLAAIKNLSDRIKSATNTTNSIHSGLSSTKDQLKLLEKTVSGTTSNVKNSLAKDADFVVSLFPGGGSFTFSSLIESAIMEELQPFMEKYGDAFNIVIDLIESGKTEKEAPQKAKAEKRGRDIKFPVEKIASLHINKVSGSFFTGKDRQALLVTDITNNQEIVGKPLVFEIDSNILGIHTGIDGAFDTRESAEDFSNIKVLVTGSKISNATFLEPAGIDKLGAGIDISASSIITRDKDYKGSVGISLKDLKLNSSNTTGKVIKTILEQSDKITFEVTYKYISNKLSMNIKSNVDKLIANAISPEKIAAEVKSFAQTELASYVKEKSDMLSDAEKQIKNLRAQIDSYEKQVDKQKKELEDKLKSLTTVSF